jgi:carboxypeptidase T
MVLTTIIATLSLLLAPQKANASEQFWMKIQAKDKFERTKIASTGVSVEVVRDDYVIAIGSAEERDLIARTGKLEVSFALTEAMDFPSKDAAFNNYAEMTAKLQSLAAANPSIMKLDSIGRSVEGRDIWVARISGDLKNADQLPASIFMGGHHAREHLSVELPLFYIEYLVTEYNKGTPRIRQLVDARDIHIIPMVNPDGAEYDIAGGQYKSWRKNRSNNNNGTLGVDLNRNYGFGWGGTGASPNPSSETYRGPAAFSEPETRAIKSYIEAHENITVLLSFHTFSQLILYPWGHIYDDIAIAKDREVHEVMAQKMATWNGYTAEKSSELYLAAGDTTDWAYGEHKIISFTFELDPADSGWGSGGFYPGADIIPQVQKKNLEPVLYMIEYSDNPYRAVGSSLL